MRRFVRAIIVTLVKFASELVEKGEVQAHRYQGRVSSKAS
jgi:hypothetical protein